MLFENEIAKVGYLSRSVPEGIDLKEAILKMKIEKNAVILAHYYVSEDIQSIADFVGDSLALAQASKKQSSDIIVFCGVHFMAETAKILNPNSKVLLPDLNAGCSLADSAPESEFIAFKNQYPDAVVVSYINCSSEIKALSDYICTSSNAIAVVNSIPKDKRIIFAPDKNLGMFVQKVTGRELILWDGACIVHVNISMDKLNALQLAHPDAELIAHPECLADILDKANFIGSTSALLNYVQSSSSEKFIVATEAGILYKMKQLVPNKTIIPAPALETNSCACSECPYMKMNTLEKLYNALYYEVPEIQVNEKTQIGALKALNNMLAV
ncbi:MAG: quinolinate synthase NadA [Flavobacterium sp.]|nr:quinolinate synthase NadA [Flavobacterium sp.]